MRFLLPLALLLTLTGPVQAATLPDCAGYPWHITLHLNSDKTGANVSFCVSAPDLRAYPLFLWDSWDDRASNISIRKKQTGGSMVAYDGVGYTGAWVIVYGSGPLPAAWDDRIGSFRLP